MGRNVDAFGNRVEQTIHKQVDRLPDMLDQIGDQFHGVKTNLGGHFGDFGSSIMDQFDQRMGGLGLGTFESTLLGDMFGMDCNILMTRVMLCYVILCFFRTSKKGLVARGQCLCPEAG